MVHDDFFLFFWKNATVGSSPKKTICISSLVMSFLLRRPLLKSRTNSLCRTWSSAPSGHSSISGSLRSIIIPSTVALTKGGRGNSWILINGYQHLYFTWLKSTTTAMLSLTVVSCLFSDISTLTTKGFRTRMCCMCRTLSMHLQLYSLILISFLKMELWHWKVSQIAELVIDHRHTGNRDGMMLNLHC